MSGQTPITCKVLPSKLIDAEDCTFLISLPDSDADDRVVDWIERFGILNPIRVNSRPDGLYRIVSGFRRFRAARRLGLKKVSCQVEQAHPSLLLLGAAVENLSTRGLDELEKATVIHKLKVDYGKSDAELIETVLPVFGIQANRQRLEHYHQLARLPAPVKRAISDGILIPEVAMKLQGWSSLEGDLFIRTVGRYRLGRNKQRKLFELLDDLRELNSQELFSVWERSGAAAIDGDESLPPELRYARIREILGRFRFPVLTQHQERYHQLKKALRLLPVLQVSAPEYFEGDSIKVSFSARSTEEFTAVVENLSRASACPELKEIFDLL